MADLSFTKKIFGFKDIPAKAKYVLSRLTQIYPKVSVKELQSILDSIKIEFREQNEKGASNHKTRMIYVSLNEIKKYNIRDESGYKKYLIDPRSVLTHETIHIVQNVYDVFPNKDYIEEGNNGKFKINYEEYVTDQGEIESRLEQIIEMLRWGFTEKEIIGFLYSRKYDDQIVWKQLVDKAKELKTLTERG